VDLLSVIRRWHFREGLSVREIARRTKLSRNTIRKYLASGDVEPVYPKRNTPSKIDDYAEERELTGHPQKELGAGCARI
jgi:transposase